MSPVRHGFVMFIGAIALGCGSAPARAETHRSLDDSGEFTRIPDRGGPFSTTRVIAKVREGVSLSFAGGLKVGFAPGAVEGEFANPSAGLVHNHVGVRGARRLFDPAAFARPELAKRIGLDRYYMIEIESGTDVPAFAGALSAHAEVFEFVQPDRQGVLTARGMGDDAPPWDPMFDNQWGLHNTGQATVCSGNPGLPGADVDALGAWELFVGNQTVVIAVIDGGVNEHADLEGRLVPGQNFAGGAADATGHGTNNHGTFMAGIIAAIPNNGIAIAGLSWDGLIMPVRVFNDFGIGFEAQVSDGIIWAADHGADILNMSLGFGPNGNATSLLHDAVIYAHGSGALLVASTGNVATQEVLFPAAFPEVIGVGATNNRDQIWSNSTTGPEMSVVAPGGGIVSLRDVPGFPDSTACDTGTSAAAAFVSGVAALLWARFPELTNDGVRAVIEATANDLGEPGFDEVFGWGRVNAKEAMEFLLGVGVPIRRPVCNADLTGDGMVDISDLLLFLQWFADGLPGADMAEPHGVFDFADILAYLLRFISGCGTAAAGV